MQNQIQNIINNFFDNINYDLASNTNVITTNNLESFFNKGIFLIVTIIISKILIFYTINNFRNIDRDIKKVNLKCRGKKIKEFEKAEYSKADHLVHSLYYISYATIYIVAGYFAIKGVF